MGTGWMLSALIALHGLIHLLGVVKAFGLAELPQLGQAISRPVGALWLIASVTMLASAVLIIAAPRTWWLVGAAALVLSQLVIVLSWRDAWAGTIPNAILLLAVVFSFLTQGPWSFQASFDREVAEGLARTIDAPVVTDADLASLPEPVQRYLRMVGVVGRPAVRNYRLRFTRRIRSGPESAWMPFEVVQQSFADKPTRLFLMRARMFGVPVEAFHRMADGHATMNVKVAGLIPIVSASGDVMDKSETVTLLNDMALLAPATLLDPGVTWEAVDARTARARFTNGSQTVSATLHFDDAGRLVNFISEDRSRLSDDGKSFTRLRFLTPVRDFRDFGVARLPAYGEAQWLLPEGAFTYGEFEIQDVEYNVVQRR